MPVSRGWARFARSAHFSAK